MATYLILNITFMIVVIGALKILGALTWNKTMAWVLVLLLILTAIFDSLLIAIGIFDYTPSKIIGLKIGNAPIEDFIYAVLALIVVPSVWAKLGNHHAR